MRLLQGLLIRRNPEPRHKPLPRDAAQHVASKEEADAAEHALFVDVREGGEEGADACGEGFFSGREVGGHGASGNDDRWSRTIWP